MIVTDEIDVPRLANNPAGNATKRDVVVYLPPSYDSGRRYPAIYLLHDYHTRAAFWPYGPSLEFAALHPPIQDVLDEAIAKKQMAEAVVVMPDGWARYGCSMWVDSAANGPFEQYVVKDVVAHVDRKYRTIPSAASRAVAGNGAGGFGAWHLGSRNPDVFGAIAMLSADSNFDLGHKALFYRWYGALYPRTPEGPTRTSMDSWVAYGLASAFTPDLQSKPHLASFPFAYPSGEIVPDVWQRWLSFDPVVSWKERTGALEKLRGILLDCGTRDEQQLHYGQRILSKRLTSAGIAHEAREYPGTHTDRMYERIPLALAWLGTVLDGTGEERTAGTR